MNLRILIAVVVALNMQYVLAQKENLPVIKANSVLVSIKEDGVLKENAWTIVPESCLDIYQTYSKEVIFYTDVDSLFIKLPKNGTFDFIILLNESDSAYTQVKFQRPGMTNGLLTCTFDFYTIIPTNTPDNFNVRTINQSFRHSLSYLIHFGISDYSLGIGAGISFNNYYYDPKPEPRFDQMTLTYIDIPIELRYVGKNGLKASAGIKTDFLVNSYYKYKGADYLYGTDGKILIKKYGLDNLSNVLTGPLVRVGWKYINIYAAYSLIPVYNSSAGNKLNPFALGISLTPPY
jgi:hypothetical protein